MMLSSSIEKKSEKKNINEDWEREAGEQSERKKIPMDWWLEDACMLDMDYFVKTVNAIKAKGVSPDMIGAVICKYAMKWLPGLAQDQKTSACFLQNMADAKDTIGSAEGNEKSRAKNRVILETLVSILPAEKGVVACSFLLRLLRMAHIVGADLKFKVELERRIGAQLEQAALTDLLIPSFSYTSHTLYDVRLVFRLVKCFVAQDGSLGEDDRLRRAAQVKVAKVLDSYLAEVALDKNFTVLEFEGLAEALPGYARTCDDGLYRALDTYLKAHPGVSDTERKRLCRLIDCKKLSADACMHASQNERLPLRTVVQILFAEQMKLRRAKQAGEKLAAPPNGRAQCPAHGCNKARCTFERENNYINILSFRLELQKIRADFEELRKQCHLMQQQVEKISKRKTFFNWIKGWKKFPKNIGVPHCISTVGDESDEQLSAEDDFQVHESPQLTLPRHRGKCRRNSVS